MGQAQVPGGVSAHGVPAEEDAIRVDREAPAGVAKTIQHRGVLLGGIPVALLVLDGPGRGDHHVAVARGLAVAPAADRPVTRPPADLLRRRGRGPVQRDDRRVATVRIVLRRELHQIPDRRRTTQPGDLQFVEAGSGGRARRGCLLGVGAGGVVRRRHAGRRLSFARQLDARRRRLDRRFHVGQELGHQPRRAALLGVETLEDSGTAHLVPGIEVLADQGADLPRRQGHRKPLRGRLAAQQPTADGQGELAFGRLALVVEHQPKRRQAS